MKKLRPITYSKRLEIDSRDTLVKTLNTQGK